MGLGATEIVILLSQVVLSAGWLWGVVSAASQPDDAYRSRGWSKAWVIVGVVVVPLGFLAYAVLVRPRLTHALG